VSTGTDANQGGLQTSPGWRVRSISAPRGFSGSNGVKFGPDGRLYVVSAFGSEIASLDIDDAGRQMVSPPGDAIASPDDLAFDSSGRLIATECMNARVSIYEEGRITTLAEGLEGANGIGVFEDRIFVDQFLLQGRLLELYRDGRPPRLMAENLDGPNGLCIAPDRMLYMVQVFSGEVVRVPIDGGEVERFVDGLSAPTSVRTGPDGAVYICQNGTGEVTRVDTQSRRRSTVVKARPGIDNLDITEDGRVLISYYTDGAVCEVVSPTETRDLVDAGLLAPYGLVDNGEEVHIADGLGMARLRADGSVERTVKFTDEGCPGFIRGIGCDRTGALYASTSAGAIASFSVDPIGSEILVEGRYELQDVAVTEDGTVLCAEAGAGQLLAVEGDGARILSDDFERPVGVATGGGAVFVTDESAGTLVKLDGKGKGESLIDGLAKPQGVAVIGGDVFVVEAAAKQIRRVSVDGVDRGAIATGLPVGAVGGGIRQTQGGLPEMIPGPMPPLAGLAAGRDGSLILSGDETGSVVVLEPEA
jgi:streptogramin lyase